MQTRPSTGLSKLLDKAQLSKLSVYTG